MRPTGVGALNLRRGTPISLLVGAGQEEGRHHGTKIVPGVGIGAALAGSILCRGGARRWRSEIAGLPAVAMGDPLSVPLALGAPPDGQQEYGFT